MEKKYGISQPEITGNVQGNFVTIRGKLSWMDSKGQKPEHVEVRMDRTQFENALREFHNKSEINEIAVQALADVLARQNTEREELFERHERETEAERQRIKDTFDMNEQAVDIIERAAKLR
jgi:D-hexose-6-phosphate mutarotase